MELSYILIIDCLVIPLVGKVAGEKNDELAESGMGSFSYMAMW